MQHTISSMPHLCYSYGLQDITSLLHSDLDQCLLDEIILKAACAAADVCVGRVCQLGHRILLEQHKVNFQPDSTLPISWCTHENLLESLANICMSRPMGHSRILRSSFTVRSCLFRTCPFCLCLSVRKVMTLQVSVHAMYSPSSHLWRLLCLHVHIPLPLDDHHCCKNFCQKARTICRQAACRGWPNSAAFWTLCRLFFECTIPKMSGAAQAPLWPGAAAHMQGASAALHIIGFPKTTHSCLCTGAKEGRTPQVYTA